MTRHSYWITLVFSLLQLAGCGETNVSWKEDVQLSSGEMIVVRRTAKTKAFGEIAGPGGWENKGMTVEIVMPTLKDKPPIWDFPFVPLLFDRDSQTNQWFMVSTFYSCESWYELGRPKLPYVEYRLRDGQWVSQPLSVGLIGKPANMLTTIRSGGEPDHTIATKAAIESDPAIGTSYRKIVANWATSC